MHPIQFFNDKQILIINPFYLSSFSDKKVNYIKNLPDCLGSFKSRNVLKVELKLADSLYSSWMQLINTLPLNWKTIIKILMKYCKFVTPKSSFNEKEKLNKL